MLIGLLFLGLILIAAGVGALAAGEATFGGAFLIGGGVLVAAGAGLLVLSRRG